MTIAMMPRPSQPKSFLPSLAISAMFCVMGRVVFKTPSRRQLVFGVFNSTSYCRPSKRNVRSERHRSVVSSV